MFAERVLQTRLVVHSPISFAARLEESIMELLNAAEVGHCKASCLIMEVLKVTGHDDLRINGASATIDVTYLARVMTLNKGDIVAGCQITARQNDITMCTSDKVDAIVQNNPIFASLAVGMRVPIVVNQVYYRTKHDKITIMGSFYIPEKKFPVYRVTSLAEPDGAILDRMRGEIEAELALRQVDSPIYKALVATLPAWPAETKPTGKAIAISDLKLKVGDIVARDTRGDLNEAICYLGGNTKGADVVSVASDAAIVAMYSEYLGWIRFVNQMCKTYDTPELLRDHKNLWIIMASQRKAKV